MIDKALLAKIRKCLALAKSANEHEAAAALAMAQRLMAEHGIDEAGLELVEVDEASARASRNVRPPRWESILAATVCHALSVVQFIDLSGDRCFVGRAPRPEIAAYAFAVLFRQLKSARATYISKELRRCKPGRKRQRADVFCEGWASAVRRKVEQLMPTPNDDEAVQRYLELQHPGLVAIEARTAKLARASGDLWNGWASGHSIELNTGISADGPPMQIAG